jgi:hypothetical protein
MPMKTIVPPRAEDSVEPANANHIVVAVAATSRWHGLRLTLLSTAVHSNPKGIDIVQDNFHGLGADSAQPFQWVSEFAVLYHMLPNRPFHPIDCQCFRRSK